MRLVGGFHPALGDAFQVLTFAARSGDFAAKDLPDVGAGLFLDPAYDAAHLTLTTKARP